MGWAIVAGSFAVLTSFFAGSSLVEPVWSENTRLLVGLLPLFAAPPLLGVINGLRGGSIATTLVVGALPVVTAVLVSLGKVLVGTRSFALTLYGGTVIVGTAGVVAALCCLGLGYAGRTVVAAVSTR